MPVTPASISRSGALDGVNFYAPIKKFYNRGNVEHFGYRTDDAAAMLMSKMLEADTIGESSYFRHRKDKGVGTTTYKYFDPVNIQAQPQGYATRWTPSNFSTPILVSEEELLETTVPEALLHRLQDSTALALLEHRERMLLDFIRGNVLDSKTIFGLEQIFYPKTHLNSGGSAASALAIIDASWKLRQANNSIGGVTRTAHTGFMSAGGTGLEGYSVNYFNDAANALKYAAGVPDVGLKVFKQLFTFCKTEMGRPIDLLFSNQKPRDDYEWAVMEKTTANREINANIGGDLMVKVDALSVDGKPWTISEYFRTQQNFSATSDDDDDVGASNIYGVSFGCIKLKKDKRQFEKLSQPHSLAPQGQHAQVSFIQSRLQTVVEAPCGFRIFGYPG
jgi:hypothetical protein